MEARTTPTASGALPLVGHLHQLARHGFIHFLQQQTALHGDTFHVWFGRKRGIVTSNADALERIFVGNRANYAKHDSYAVMRPCHLYQGAAPAAIQARMSSISAGSWPPNGGGIGSSTMSGAASSFLMR